jgi:hypothetical protein
MDLQNRQQPLSSIKTGMTDSKNETSNSPTLDTSLPPEKPPLKSTPSKKMPLKMIVGLIILVLTIIGGIAGYILTQTSQDVRQQATGVVYKAGDPCSTEDTTACDQNNKILTCEDAIWRQTTEDCEVVNDKEVIRYKKTTSKSNLTACQKVQIQVSDPNFDDTYSSMAACEASIGYCCVQNITIAGLTPGECSATGGAIGQCSQDAGSVCKVGEEVCKSNSIYKCTAAANGNFYSNTGESCSASCTSEADCIGSDIFCNGTTKQCEPLNTAVGYDCNPEDTLSGGNAGQACCVGGTQECKSGACSGPSGGTIEGKIGTCLGGVGGPVTEPTQDECAAQGGFRCGDCGGFCATFAENKTCKQLSYEKLAAGQCPQGVQNGGSCALQGYNNASNSCEEYCTNILGKDGDDCGVGRPCEYIGPENPAYPDRCPEGNGFSSFGWDGECFKDYDSSRYIANTYYCECPNGDCTGVNLGSGCQKEGQSGACFQGGTCGVLQIDLDSENPPAGMPNHTSRNKMVTTGCNVQPQPPTTPPDDVIINQPTSSSPQPSPTPISYFCNSTCSTDAQCQTADSNFTCNAAEGNRCRLTNNPTSAECQPPVGQMCLSLSLTNVSNPSAGATDDPQLGDAVSFTCGLVNGADHYIFRVIEPDQTIVDLNATGATSSQYTITKDGPHAAQCQICTGTDASTCHAYEDPFN